MEVCPCIATYHKYMYTNSHMQHTFTTSNHCSVLMYHMTLQKGREMTDQGQHEQTSTPLVHNCFIIATSDDGIIIIIIMSAI